MELVDNFETITFQYQKTGMKNWLIDDIEQNFQIIEFQDADNIKRLKNQSFFDKLSIIIAEQIFN
jgi:hypothetical protein